ncbi:MAG: hypothetical protein AB8B99_12890 [Phormidesmis sp.]
MTLSDPLPTFVQHVFTVISTDRWHVYVRRKELDPDAPCQCFHPWQVFIHVSTAAMP